MDNPLVFANDNSSLLPYTLQTSLGMVLYNGAPKKEPIPKQFQDQDQARIAANRAACQSNEVSLLDIKRIISLRKRVDMEKAAAMMLSVQEEKDRRRLIPFVEHMFATCSMWIPEEARLEESALKIQSSAERRLFVIQQILHKNETMPQAEAPSLNPPVGVEEIVDILVRVRRNRPKLSNSQQLRLPPFLDPYKRHRYAREPLLLITKQSFRKLHRSLWRLEGDPAPDAKYRRKVKSHAENIELPKNNLEILMRSKDPLAVGFSFIALQRRLQLRVVSNIPKTGWATFLRRGETNLILQNRPDIFTSFEHAIAALLKERKERTDWSAAASVVKPPGSGRDVTGDETARLWSSLTTTCLLMREYVELFGGGDFKALTFNPSVKGGSGRGPVDFYNLLVDVAMELKQRLTDRGEKVKLERCQKFLAKDIMAWNRSWDDDAFANGRIPGWVEYLKERGL